MKAESEPQPVPAALAPVLVIEPPRRWQAIDLPELWRYRELLYFLAWRDVKVRYKQTALGIAWAVLQPVMTMIVFTIFFGRLGGLAERVAQHDSAPYPLFLYAGILPWTFFSAAVSQAAMSLIGSANLISKVYFPRLLVPLSAVLTSGVDFVLSLVVMFVLLAGYGFWPGASLLALPLLCAAVALAAAGIGTGLAALVVAYRDFRYVVPFALQIWMFASPVAYPLGVVPVAWRWAYALNPMAGLIGGFRWALLGEPLDIPSLVVSLSVAVALAIGGALYFKSVERRMADIV